MKRVIIITALTLALAGVYAISAFAAPEEEVIGGVRNLSTTSWSPDGTQIVFAASGDLYLTEIATGEVTLLTGNNEYVSHYPVFSHDGTEIYFSQYHHSKLEQLPNTWDARVVSLQALNLATGETRLLIEGAYAADLSHDGKHLVYNKDFKYRAIYNLETGKEKIFDISGNT